MVGSSEASTTTLCSSNMITLQLAVHGLVKYSGCVSGKIGVCATNTSHPLNISGSAYSCNKQINFVYFGRGSARPCKTVLKGPNLLFTFHDRTTPQRVRQGVVMGYYSASPSRVLNRASWKKNTSAFGMLTPSYRLPSREHLFSYTEIRRTAPRKITNTKTKLKTVPQTVW